MLTRETIVAAINSNDPAEIKKLKKQGLELIWQDKRGTTLLHFAASEGKSAIVDYLLKHKIHPDKPFQYTTDKQDKDDLLERTPLVCAVTKKHSEVVRLLLSAGADIHKENRLSGYSPLGAAMIYHQTATDAAVREQRQAILDLLETHDKKQKEKIELEKKYASLRHFNFPKKEAPKSTAKQNSACTIL